jgi:diguanylate cyclase (GGDEF)-like protein
MRPRRQEGDERAAPAPGLVAHITRWARLTTAAFALIAVALVALLVANERIYAPQVRRAVDATRAVRLIHEAMLDQETALRAFLLTGDERFLGPYRRGRSELADVNAEAQRLLGSSSTTSALLADLRVAQAAWVEGWTGDALAAGRTPGTDPDDDELLRDGQELFDAYRVTYDRLGTELVHRRDHALDDQTSALRIATGLAFLGTLVLAVGSLRRNRQLRRSVGPALMSIDDHLDRIAAGDFRIGPTVARPAELHRIEQGLDDAARGHPAGRGHVQEQNERTPVQKPPRGPGVRLAREVAGSLNLRYVVRGVCTAASAIAGDRRVVVWLREEHDSLVVAAADSSGPGFNAIGLDPVALGEGAVGRAARFGRIEGQDRDLLEVVDDTGGGSLAVPMVVGAEVIGVLEVADRGAGSLDPSTVDVLEALAVQAATAVGAARLHEHTETLAMTDALTRLPNRRRLEADLATEVGVSARYGRPLGFAMIDVDHFKAYNDTLGHQAADVALQELANLLAGEVRTGDTVYRYGGEEIAIVMRETDGQAALQHADRVRGAVAHHFSSPNQPRALTVSIGVASMPAQATTAEQLVAAADAALYEAKHAGRDRVRLSGQETAVTPVASLDGGEPNAGRL